MTRIGKLTLVDVRGVGLLPGLGALLFVAGGSGCLLASLLLFSRRLAGRGLAAGGGSLGGLGGHFGSCGDVGGVGENGGKAGAVGEMEWSGVGVEMDEGEVVDGGGRATYGERAQML